MKEAGLDAEAIWTSLGRGETSPNLWLDPDNDAMHYRGNELRRIKFFVSLTEDGRVPRYSYDGFQWTAMPLYHARNTPSIDFVVKLADKISGPNGLRRADAPEEFFSCNQAIGTLYKTRRHKIGTHSDRPRDIKPGSWIFDISFGADREFVMHERTDAEQHEWINQHGGHNLSAAAEPYCNHLGRTTERVTMTHGSAILLTTSTNSRWTHEVPPPRGPFPGPRASLVFRDIVTQLTPGVMAKAVAKAKRDKIKRQAIKESKNNAPPPNKARRPTKAPRA